ncbi:unnamed protein product [Ixodes pacificus]
MVDLLKHIKSSITFVIKIRSVQSCLIDMDPVNMVTPLYREQFLGLTWVNTCIFVSVLWTAHIMYAFLGNSGVYINEKLVYGEISEIVWKCRGCGVLHFLFLPAPVSSSCDLMSSLGSPPT